MGCVFHPKGDVTQFNVAINSVFQVFAEFDIVVPYREYEDKLEELLTTKLPDNIPSGASGKHVMAVALLNLAKQMHVSKNKLREIELAGLYDMHETGTMLDLQEIDKFKKKHNLPWNLRKEGSGNV